jgi:long-chain acyl-CoA synthetase
MYTARELKHQLLLGARAIVIVENFAHVLQQVRGEVLVEFVITTQIGDLLRSPKPAGQPGPETRRKAVPPDLPGAVSFRSAPAQGVNFPAASDSGPDDIAFLQYTGGTTGVSRAPCLPTVTSVANMLQSAPGWRRQGIDQATRSSSPRYRFIISSRQQPTAWYSWPWAHQRAPSPIRATCPLSGGACKVPLRA